MSFACLASHTTFVVLSSQSSGFHPQSNRAAKPGTRKRICILCSEEPTSWSFNLVWVEYVHNYLPSASTGLSSFQAATIPASTVLQL
ncbi:uncharacterized protein LOC118598371, partial [Tachysurus ichikawai]